MSLRFVNHQKWWDLSFYFKSQKKCSTYPCWHCTKCQICLYLTFWVLIKRYKTETLDYCYESWSLSMCIGILSVNCVNSRCSGQRILVKRKLLDELYYFEVEGMCLGVKSGMVSLSLVHQSKLEKTNFRWLTKKKSSTLLFLFCSNFDVIDIESNIVKF